MRKFYLLGLVVLLFSCNETRPTEIIEFTSAQPQGKKDFSSFPKRLQGHYSNLTDYIDLEITNYHVIKRHIGKDTIDLRDTFFRLTEITGDTIYDKESSMKFKFRRLGDSLATDFYYLYTDTIFDLEKGDKLRKMKGYFFLNQKYGDSSWGVRKLVLKNGVLNLNYIGSEEEIKLLQTITETKQDSIRPFIANPTKKQFREFIKKNGFSNGESFIKK
jgi:hypothetical protein